MRTRGAATGRRAMGTRRGAGAFAALAWALAAALAWAADGHGGGIGRTVPATTGAAAEVDIPDPGLRAALEAELGKGPGEAITVAEMETLTSLSARHRGIRDLTGLEFATGAHRLDLDGNEIADLSPLAGLASLWYLYLDDAAVSDLSPLSGLASLRALYLDDTAVSDLSPLSGLAALETLYLPGTAVSDLSPLSGLTVLKVLAVWSTAVSDLSPLSSLASLRYLSLDDTAVSDPSPLSGLAALENLSLSGTAVADLSPLSGLTALERLSLDRTAVSDLSGLEELTALKTLRLARLGSGYAVTIRVGASGTTTTPEQPSSGDGGVSDLSPLAGLTGLVELDLSGNEVSDLSPLAGLTGLKRLNLSDNEVSDLSPLPGLAGLVELDLSSNEVSDLSPLSGLAGLADLDLSGNEVSYLSPLAGLTGLRWLNLWNNEVTDLSPLAGLAALESLGLSHNAVTDLSPLAGLTALKALGFWNNEVTDLSPLAGLTALERLGLFGNEVADLTPLAGLTALEHLGLNGNAVTDLSGLEDLSALEELWLFDNEVSDLSPLAGLTGLRKLYLEGNAVSDLSGLEGLSGLETLWIGFNPVSDLSPLAGLTGLRVLVAQHNRAISDLSPLSGLSGLDDLSLDGNLVSDLSPLSGLSGLVELGLSGNRVADPSPLSGLSGLRDLILSVNPLDDEGVAALAALTGLERLRIGYNSRVADVGPLSGLAGLADLDLAHTSVEDLSPLLGLPNLRALHVDDAPARPADVAALAAAGVAVSGTPLVAEEEVGAGRLRVYGDVVATLRLESAPADRSAVDAAAWSRAFYEEFEDEFDYLMFFLNRRQSPRPDDGFAHGTYHAAGNAAEGTGWKAFRDERFGSSGRLLGVAFFPYRMALRYGPSLHELMHAWANHAVPTSAPGHWGFSSAAGQLGGFRLADLVDLGGGRYAVDRWFGTVANGGNRVPYSLLELYLAGLAGPEEVPELWVAEDGEWLRENGRQAYTAAGRPVFSASAVRRYSVADLAALHGARRPGPESSRRRLRGAAVLLSEAGRPARAVELHELAEQARWFAFPGADGHYLYNYHEATRGRGELALDGLTGFLRRAPALWARSSSRSASLAARAAARRADSGPAAIPEVVEPPPRRPGGWERGMAAGPDPAVVRSLPRPAPREAAVECRPAPDREDAAPPGWIDGRERFAADAAPEDRIGGRRLEAEFGCGRRSADR